jgi:Bacteriophage head to tail connecting protein
MSTEIGTDLASVTLQRWEAMKSTRFNWMIQWDDCARYIMPRKGNILTKYTPGQAQTINLYDTTAEEAALIFAAGTITHIVPPGEKWFRLQAKDVNASPAVKDWWADTTDRCTDALLASNFYLGIHEDFLDAGIFGTSALFEEESKKKKLNFVNIPVGTFAIDENAEGMVDTFAREWKWTARQAAQKWGQDKLGRMQQEALKSRNAADWNKTFTYIHFVEPRPEANYQGGPVSASKRPFRSLYLCVEDKQVIDEGGYYTMPYFVSRLLRSNNEIYGRGPGIQAMPEIRLVNAMERDLLTAIEKMVNPPWLAPDDTSSQIDGRPNGITYYDSANPANKPEQLQLKNNIDLGEKKTEQKRERIRRAFYNDLFQMLTNLDEQKREKTAYEVQQMVAEKLLLFSPLFARMKVEKVDPIIERTIDILARNGQLAPMPPEMAQGGEYEIVVTSKIALAIKAAENQAFATMMTLVEQVAAIDPSVRNVIKWDESVRDIAGNVGMRAKNIRTKREADALTQQQEKAAQAAQAAQTGELASRAVKNLGPEAQTQAARKIVGGAGTPAAA